jgi:NADPH:quinone reductase-like Zn-dependent oxidoreductase
LNFSRIEKVKIAIPPLKGRQLIVRVLAAALNHRDYYCRQDLYPAVKFGIPVCSDGCGVVVATGPSASSNWLNKRVVINPGIGWNSDPDSPESDTGYITLGASSANTGTLQEYMLVEEEDVFQAPETLTPVEIAAIPSAGLTAWRSVMVQSRNAIPGRNILVTGIGGGVALFALSFALAAGCNVFVSSSSEEKIRRAVALGATAGVNYTQPDWHKKLLSLLPPERKTIDAIIDGAGGDIVDRGVKVLRHSGVIVSYGMTVSPRMTFSMKAVIRQIQLISCTMGSRRDFANMMDCIRVKKIRPVVSKVITGLDDVAAIDKLIDELSTGKQFGKLVVDIAGIRAASRL